jgi:ribosome biogenesis protein MAK21
MKRSMPSADDKDIDDDDSLSVSGSGIEEPELSGNEEGHSEGDSSDDQSEGSDVSEEDDKAEAESEEDSEGVLSIGNDDVDDILESDAELPESVPDGLIHFSSEEDNENAPWGGINSSVAGVKRKAGKQDDNSGRKKKKRLKDLPLFASLEDYEKLIDAQPEDNI